MKAVKISVVDGAINLESIEVPGEKSLQALYSAIGCRMIEMTYSTELPGHVLVVDEEGRLKDDQATWIHVEGHGNIAGNIVVLGETEEDCDTTDVQMSLDDMRPLFSVAEPTDDDLNPTCTVLSW